MPDSLHAQIAKLRQSLAVLAAQRAVLGDAIDPAIDAARVQLTALEDRAAAELGPMEERRIITILFTDIVGSTSLAEKLDPEDWRDAVSAVHAMAGRVIQQHGGLVLQYLGDGLLALFGAQTPSESDPENAVRAALDIQAGLATLQTSQPIQLRIGVHTGLVILAEIGSEVKRELSATGDPTNLAARLQTAAPPGGVLMSHDTYRYVRGIFEVTPQPPLSLKGKSELIQAYLVQRAKPRPFRTVTRGVTGIEARTVGRDLELKQLQTAVTAAFQDHTVVWAQLVGEPGMGKSRLLSDMKDYLDLRPESFRWLRARASQGDEKHAFALIRRMWFDRFQITEDAPLAEAEAKWQEQFLALHQAGSAEAAHALGLLVGLPFSSSPYIGAMRNDPEQVKGRAVVVSREFLAGIRHEMPIVALLDDLHWADSSSWDYLAEVFLSNAKNVAAAPNGMLIMATARPEWNPPAALLKHSAYLQINVTSLSNIACHELASELLRRVENVPDSIIQLIVDRSEGVPYFVEEMINWFLDRGIIDQHSDPWHFDPVRLKESPLPATLQHLLLTRLSSLPDAERVALQRGSVFGRNFWESGLATLGINASGQMLTQLQPRNFVDRQPESSLEGETEWSFHHNLLYEVAYESVLKRERKELHQAAATWLETQARQAGRLDEFVGILGEQAERAGELSTAADWYVRAGDQARARGALQEARKYYERALELMPPTDRVRRWPALLGQSDVLSLVGDKEAYRASVMALSALAQELDDKQRAEAYYRQGSYLNHTGDYRKALQAHDAALAAANQAGNDQLITLILGAKVIDQGRLGESDGAAATARTLLTRASAADQATQAKAWNNLAVYFMESGDLAKAAQLLSEQAALNHRLDDRNAEAIALGNLGYNFVLLGMYAAGRAPLEQSIKILQSIGERRQLGYSWLNLGLAYWRSGDRDAARQVLEQVQSELAMQGDTFAQAAGRSYLALVEEQSGDMASAVMTFTQARDMFKGVGVQSYATDALAGLARCALAQGDLGAARQYASEAWDYLTQHGAQGMEFPIRAYQTCAEVFAAIGESTKSRAAIEEGYRDLIRRAKQISNLEWGKSFLTNVPEHKAIIDLWDRVIDPAGTYSGQLQEDNQYG